MLLWTYIPPAFTKSCVVLWLNVTVRSVLNLISTLIFLSKVQFLSAGSMLYQKMVKHVLTLVEQHKTGYPRPASDDSGRAIVDASLLFRTMKIVGELEGKQLS
jgi:hypothetical protein